MRAVDKLIFNLMVSHRSFMLPGVGALRYERDGAQLVNKKKIEAPKHRVVFSSQTEGVENIVDIIAVEAQCDTEQAEKIYHRWFIVATEDKSKTVIEGVGEIRSGFFYPDSELAMALNPLEGGIELTPRGKSKTFILSMWFFAIVVAAIAAVYYLLYYLPVEQSIEKSVEQEQQPPKIEVEATPPDPIEQNIKEVMANPETKPYQVIVGAFSNEANANKFISKLKEKEGDILCYVIQNDSRYLVSLGGADTEAEAEGLRDEFRTIDPGIWIKKP